MPSSDSSHDVLLEQLAAEFVDRHRGGEHPPLSEYTARYPDLADDIRELFPALVQIEQLKPPAGATGCFEPAALTANDTRLERLGEYRILREVGRGGMGVVYEAEQESLGRHVALKVLPASALLNPTYLERFRREAKAAARLHHTNIVPVFGVGEADGVPFYAMQFIRGEGLDKVLADVRRLRLQPGQGAPATVLFERSIANSLLTGQFVPPATEATSRPAEQPAAPSASGLSAAGPEAEYCRGVARLGLQVAEALAYAHRQGILHRDIKPSNLLLDTQGIVWITDFGLAKSEGTDELTQTGDIVGTIRFMAPERFEGKSLPQGDVYALGVTLYELLTLRPAFDDTNKARLIGKVVHDLPPPPRKIDPRVPRDLETVVLKCLAKEPRERYASADALAEDLRRFLADRPIRARRTGLWERALKWGKRRPATAALVAVSGLAALALVGLAVGLWYNSKLSAALRETKDQRAKADRERKRFETLEVSTRYLRDVSLAAQAWQDARVAQTRRLLNLWRPRGAAEPDLRGWEWYYLRGLCHKDFRTLRTTEPALFYSVAFHPDSRRIAVSGWNGKIYVWDVVDGRRVHTLQGHTGRVDEVAFSPDGSQLASAGWEDRCVRLWDVASGRQVHRIQAGGAVRSVAFSPDGRSLAFAGEDRGVALWDVARKKEIRRFVGHTAPIYCVSFSPDGKRLASAGTDRTARIWDAAGGESLRILVGHRQQVSSVAFSPDGRTLATSSEDYTVKVWNPDTGKLRATLEGHAAWAYRVAFSPDGRWLASASDDMTVRFWDVVSNKLVRVLRGHEGAFLRGIAFSPDGRFLATAAQRKTVKVWDLTSGPQEYRLLRPGPAARVGGVAFAADGRRLASASRDLTVRLWDAASGRQIRILRGHRGEVRCVAFGAGDKLLASGSYDGTVKLWDVDTGEVQRTLTGHKDGVENVAFSHDGRRLASASWDKTVKVWDARTGRETLTLQTNGPSGGVAFSPDGRWLAAGAAKTVKLWDAETGQELRTLEGFKEAVAAVAFSRDGSLLAAAGRHGEEGVKLWEPLSGHLTHTLEGLWGYIYSMSFSPDGRRLAAAGEDGKVKIWDTTNGQEILTLRGHTSNIYSIAFSPDGRWLASAGAGIPILLWEAPPEGGAEARDRAALLAPEHILRWHLNEAEDCLQAGQRSAALWHVNRLGHPPLTDPLLFTRLAGIRTRFGRWADVVGDATAALRLQPDNPDAQFLRGQACQKLGRHAEAVADFTAVLTRYPSSAQFYDLRAASQEALGKAGAARADRERAIQLRASAPKALNNQAWQLVTCAAGRRDPVKALQLIRQALKQQPDNATFLNTLGVVQYRNGHYREAVAALEKSLTAGKGQFDAFDLIFLAMCHARLGDAARARDCYARAVKWVEGQKNLSAQHQTELKAFRAEAEELLSKEAPPK